MILSNGYVMCGDFSLKRLDLKIEGERISELGEGLRGDLLDMTDKIILPGFIDTHIHGAYGARISDKDPDLSAVTRFEAGEGVTSIAITTASSEFSDILSQFDKAVSASLRKEGSKIVAIHAEGPFISKKYKGAMNSDYIISADVQRLYEMIERAKGLLKIITVAPEIEGAEALIKHATEKGITVSLGHTDATYGEAIKGIEAGATQLTHTFNAMRAFNHREPGIVGAGLTSESVTLEVICDYVHLHPATVKLIYDIKGADRISIISDSGHAAGMKVSEFVVDGLTRYVKDGVVRLADGTIAGSAKTILDGVRNLISSGIPIEDVSKMASFNPARALKMEEKIGSIEEGKIADLVVLDKDYKVAYTFIDGKLVYKRQE